MGRRFLFAKDFAWALSYSVASRPSSKTFIRNIISVKCCLWPCAWSFFLFFYCLGLSPDTRNSALTCKIFHRSASPHSSKEERKDLHPTDEICNFGFSPSFGSCERREFLHVVGSIASFFFALVPALISQS